MSTKSGEAHSQENCGPGEIWDSNLQECVWFVEVEGFYVLGEDPCTDPDEYYDYWYEECICFFECGDDYIPTGGGDNDGDGPPGGGGGGSGDGDPWEDDLPSDGVVLDFDLEDLVEEEIEGDTIDCNNPVHLQAESIRAWCEGTPVSQSQYSSRVHQALNRIEQRGPFCQQLADLGRQMISRDRITLHSSPPPRVWQTPCSTSLSSLRMPSQPTGAS